MKTLSIIIPESVVNYELVANDVSKVFAKLFEGFNQYEGNGGWVDEAGNLVSEKHIKVESFVKPGYMEAEKLSKILSVFLKVDNNQDCIAVQFDGNASIISGEDQIIDFLLNNFSDDNE